MLGWAQESDFFFHMVWPRYTLSSLSRSRPAGLFSEECSSIRRGDEVVGVCVHVHERPIPGFAREFEMRFASFDHRWPSCEMRFLVA